MEKILIAALEKTDGLCDRFDRLSVFIEGAADAAVYPKELLSNSKFKFFF